MTTHTTSSRPTTATSRWASCRSQSSALDTLTSRSGYGRRWGCRRTRCTRRSSFPARLASATACARRCCSTTRQSTLTIPPALSLSTWTAWRARLCWTMPGRQRGWRRCQTCRATLSWSTTSCCASVARWRSRACLEGRWWCRRFGVGWTAGGRPTAPPSPAAPSSCPLCAHWTTSSTWRAVGTVHSTATASGQTSTTGSTRSSRTRV
mmetsp:Transcript_41267/g.123229  ORF Transcript_41267/g.123229 Transcript_41267/m.123229 type:complete len:208 (-) Transcript_41267:299-922(-)